MDRRKFINSVALSSIAVQSGCVARPMQYQDQWKQIADMWANRDHDVLNFNTGSASMMPTPIKKAYTSYIDKLSAYAPYEVLLAHSEQIAKGQKAISDLIEASTESVAILRNTTEAINAVLTSFPFQEGDEILCASLDYPHMEYTIDHLVSRKGVKVRRIKIKEGIDSDERIVQLYSDAITDRTRLMVITHMTHRSGQILPAHTLCKLARDNGIYSFIDGAHIIGQLPASMSSLDCDYFASSLHKWMYAPLGTGLLYVRPGSADHLQPHYSFPTDLALPMDRFKRLGTIAFQNTITLNDVVEFHHSIGAKEKQSRLEFLNNRLMEGVKNLKDFQLVSDTERSCAVSAIKPRNKNASKVKRRLEEDHAIHIKVSGYSGNFHLRSSVNLHMEESDVDRLLNALESVG